MLRIAAGGDDETAQMLAALRTTNDNLARVVGVAKLRRVTQLIGEISNATREQTSGITQVVAAVAQLDQVTQQNAALVEESAAAAESLKRQAAQLVEPVAVFQPARVA